MVVAIETFKALVSVLQATKTMKLNSVRSNQFVKCEIFPQRLSVLHTGEFPWTVAVLREERAVDKLLNVYQCGGSLISAGVVLSEFNQGNRHNVGRADCLSIK